MSMGSIRKGSDLCLSCSNALFKTWMAASTDQAVRSGIRLGISRCIKAASRLMLLYWLYSILFRGNKTPDSQQICWPWPSWRSNISSTAWSRCSRCGCHHSHPCRYQRPAHVPRVCMPWAARVGPMVVKQRGCVGFKTYSSLKGAILDWRVEDWGQSHLRMKLN